MKDLGAPPARLSERDRRRQRAHFLLGASAAFGSICAAGWLSGLRGALHGVVLTAGAVALLPFIILTAGVLILCAGAALAAVTGGGGDLLVSGGADGIVTGGGKLVARYYEILWSSRRHALLLGLGTGAGIAAALLALVLWFFVVPREAETLAVLLDAKARIEAAGGPSSGLEPPVIDAFGRPVEYRREGSWLTASYVLTSRGFDGKESPDDLCVAGRSRAGALLDHARHPLETLRALREGGLGAAERAQAVRDMRCEHVLEEPKR